ncbi:MAG: hypothetical protein J4203_07185 [Candidatus Diapherotrites archaeon]|uniref:Uncharacterized protein n=1 Tax=Candidatus Iainarchaeum sp. TaxID=3101447 RepID=A0A8T4L8P1_9ARCH|nr:hypothetical protein [Candidatus Diapherotrites archaeon]
MFQNFTAEQLREIVEEIARVLETCLTVYAFGGAVMVFDALKNGSKPQKRRR